jgi:hypothetical protein
MIEFINIALLILMLWVTYVLLQKFSPIVSIDFVSPLNKEQLDEKYFKFYRLSIIGIIAGVPVLTLILKWLIDKAINFRLSFLADVLIVVPPHNVLVWVGAGFLGLYLAYTIVIGICYNYLLHDWDEFLIYTNEKLRFDIVVKGSYFNRFFSLFLVLFILMLFDNFSTFGDEEVKTNSFLGLGTTKYPYANVTELKDIAKSKDLFGNLSDQPYYEIVFKDDAKWSSKNSGFPTYDENTRIITLVSTRVNTYIKRLEYE